MSELGLIREWFQYNRDARHRYLDVFDRLPPQELTRDRGASYPLLDIYLHVLDAYRIWIHWVTSDRVKEWEEQMSKIRLRERLRTVVAARDATRDVEREVADYLDALSETGLDRRLEFDDHGSNGSWFRNTVVVRDLLWHLVEEELQHRGEMNALLWQMGQEPPVLEWVHWKAGHRGA